MSQLKSWKVASSVHFRAFSCSLGVRAYRIPNWSWFRSRQTSDRQQSILCAKQVGRVPMKSTRSGINLTKVQARSSIAV